MNLAPWALFVMLAAAFVAGMGAGVVVIGVLAILDSRELPRELARQRASLTVIDGGKP